MDDLPKNMTKAGPAASAFDMGNRHVPMLPEQNATSAAAGAAYAGAVNRDKFAANRGTLNMKILRRHFLGLTGPLIAAR